MIAAFGILLLAIAFIIVATTRFRLHPFMALLFTAYGVGILAGMPLTEITPTILSKFGSTLGSIGIIIIAGTIIGVMLEKSGATLVISKAILDKLSAKRPNLALSVIGFLVSIPVFCDAAFVILSSLNKTLSVRTKTSVVSLSIALATGLFAPHVLVPPTPGPIAAAANLQIDNLFLVIFVGLLVAVPVVLVGYLFSLFLAKKYPYSESAIEMTKVLEKTVDVQPKLTTALLPIFIPILLMALGTFSNVLLDSDVVWLRNILGFLGNPTTALLIGMLFSLRLLPFTDEKKSNTYITEGLKNAAMILMITGAGGALGGVIAYMPMGMYLENLQLTSLGLLLPFLIAAVLKTAQGSSTVSIITTTAIVFEMLPALGLDSESGKVLTVMAVGCGAMTVSHANDSYFWVVSQLSGLHINTAYKTLTIASLLQGITGILTVLALSLFV
ncbi:MAG: GntP family permease [Flavobacteriaceae bacterium]|nr:GntP family permease [Flavobacteriaceae bacterium]